MSMENKALLGNLGGNEPTPSQTVKKRINKKKIWDNVFFWSIAILPIAFIIFQHIVVNGNSFLLAFTSYKDDGSRSFAGLDNFKLVIKDIKSEWFKPMLGRSFLMYIIGWLTEFPILFVAFYIFKKYKFSGFFKIMMYIPLIVSGIITVLIYKFLCERVAPFVASQWGYDMGVGLLSNKDTRFGALLFYGIWLGIGGGLLTTVAAMNSTDLSTIEAGKLDGVGFFGEFFHIVLPKAYPIISIGWYTGIVSIWTNKSSLYTFYADHAPQDMQMLGYRFFIETLNTNEMGYPRLAAWGLVQTFISLPILFGLRYFWEHIGPSED